LKAKDEAKLFAFIEYLKELTTFMRSYKQTSAADVSAFQFYWNRLDILSEDFMDKQDHFQKQQIINTSTGEIFDSVKDAAETYDTTGANIWSNALGNSKSAKGCTWEFHDE